MPIPIVLEKRVVKERIENARRTYEITLPKGEIDFSSEDLKEKVTTLLFNDYFKERNLGADIELFRDILCYRDDYVLASKIYDFLGKTKIPELELIKKMERNDLVTLLDKYKSDLKDAIRLAVDKAFDELKAEDLENDNLAKEFGKMVIDFIEKEHFEQCKK
jgi:hypothetical protein